jgi:hypothetical protein
MDKQLLKLQKQFQKTQTKDKVRFVFNGVYYPREFESMRVMSDGQSLLIDNRKIDGNKNLYQSGSINHWNVDLLGGTDLIEGTFPSFLDVIPKNADYVYKFTVPEWVKDIKECCPLCLDLDSLNISHTPISENYIILNFAYLSWLAGCEVFVGIGKESLGLKSIAIWDADHSYNPTQNAWTFILMCMKLDTNEKPLLGKIEISSGVLETV